MKTPLLQSLTFNNTFARLPSYFYNRQSATPLQNTQLIALSTSAAKLLDIKHTDAQREFLTAVCSGNEIWPGSEPLSMIYSGHQFGIYNPQLGDGRGLLLGEAINQAGEKWDIHLKGAGITPYSRSGDGRAVLRSCIREFLGSEALHHLSIPTTRALCVVSSDTPVYRETVERGSTLLRLARTHIRFGHFEYFSYSGQQGDLKLFADYTIEQYFPLLANNKNKYLLFFEEVIQVTAKLIAQWQAVGFAHGVMNTDNMSILGDTFDYGPFAFLDNFNWRYICNDSDHQGRYAFDQQPNIGHWNCGRLGSALLPLLKNDTVQIQKALDQYPTQYMRYYTEFMRQKLGLLTSDDADVELIQTLLSVLQSTSWDYTQFFRKLCDYLPNQDDHALKPCLDSAAFNLWLQDYSQRIKSNPFDHQYRQQQMKKVNPKFILRNYLAHQAIENAEAGDFSEIATLLKLLEAPYDEHPEYERYAALPPDWAKKLKVNCSS